MNYEEVYEDEGFEEKFTEALVEAASPLPKFFSIGAQRPAVFRDRTERITRFSFPGMIAAKGGEAHEGFIFGEVQIDFSEDGYTVAIPELNFQESQAALG
ncbi:MAG TPA: hypothetical protein VNB29_08955 [Chthoniobacterales bacterium]|nr:hypothetical protein [Chthoniobacterales bacterium]